MKHIINVLKRELFNQNTIVEGLIKKVEVSQNAYYKNRSNEAFFNIWSDNVKQLQKAESNINYLRSAYVTICNACEIEPMSFEAIIKEKADRKPRQKCTPKNVEPKEEEK